MFPLPALWLSLGAVVAPPAVETALAAAVTVPEARLELMRYRPTMPRGCVPAAASPLRPIETTGEVPLRVTGHGEHGEPCEGWAWARVRLIAKAWVTTRRLREGEPFAGAVLRADRELAPGRPLLAELPPGAVAAHGIAAGAAVDAVAVRSGPANGDPVRVVVRAGSLWVEQLGRALPCTAGRGCAQLPSGRRVSGRLDGDVILLEAP